VTDLVFSILHIRVATVGYYAREPDSGVHSFNELSLKERIAWALLNRKAFRDTCENEGVNLRSRGGLRGNLQRRKGNNGLS